MRYTVKYYCPKHKKELLDVDEVNGTIFKLFMPERPLTCARCQKAYYRSECIAHRYDYGT
jgi:hypothetical protein